MKFFRLFAWVMVSLLGGCSSEYPGSIEYNPGPVENLSTEKTTAEIVPTPPLELVQKDIVALAKQPHLYTGDEHTELAQAYQKLFLGFKGQDLADFLKERTANFFILKKLPVDFSPSDLKFTGWKNAGKTHRFESGLSSSNLILSVGAINAGMEYWFQGLVDGRVYSVWVGSRWVKADSPKSGIIGLGPMYTDFVEHKGEWKPMPETFRRAILLHEARHSDCPNGFTEEGLEEVRQATSYESWRQGSPDVSCGNFHSVCPEFHPYEGFAACDAHAWGSYTVDWLFHEIEKAGETKGSQPWQIANILALDAKSRLQFSTQRMLRGKLGEPGHGYKEPTP